VAVNQNTALEENVEDGQEIMTPAEVARLFRVDPKTVTRWAKQGRFGSFRTPGGHRRFRRTEVMAALEGNAHEPTLATPRYPR
jgi:excisionase family DNA binding protein